MSETPAIPIDTERLIHLLREMVDIYSPSGKEEELSDFLVTTMTDHGLSVVRQPVDETRCNLLVSAGPADAADTLFLGHIDTVPAFDIEHYGFEMGNGTIHGLGTADMKSGCAAMIEAFIAASAVGALPRHVLLALVVGEEVTGDGTQALLQHARFRQALVAEPTDLNVCLDHYGYVEMDLRAFGYRRHAAMSDHTTNAIRIILRLLLKLEEEVERSSPHCVLNIRDLHSSESGFAVPDRCAASIDMHVPPDTSTAEFSEHLRHFLEKELAGSSASRHEIEFPTLADGYQTSPQAALPLHLKATYEAMKLPWRLTPFKSHSDANLLHDAGCQSLILGPGQLAKAHTRDESVAFSQVSLAAQIYTRLLADLA